MNPTTCESLKGRRVKVRTADGLERTGWCEGTCAHRTRMLLDRVTSISLVRLEDVVQITPAPLTALRRAA